MHSTIEKLLAGGPVITDGAWGTELQARGLSVGDCPDAWNVTQPERVLEVARSYVSAGSRVILTNTFGANSIRLRECGVDLSVGEINRGGVEISRRAAGETAMVFASVGPSGKLILTGDVTADELRAAFEEQVNSIAAAGAHGIVIETMSDLEEAVIAITAAKATGLPVVASMAFDSGQQDRTMMGVTPEQAAETLSRAGADVIGANCGAGIAAFENLCRRFRAVSDKPLWMKANAGLPQIVNGEIAYRADPADFARAADALIQAGANFIGGCCGTNPKFIRALSERHGAHEVKR